MVAEAGLEPARPIGHRILNPERLPIPPLGHYHWLGQNAILPQQPVTSKNSAICFLPLTFDSVNGIQNCLNRRFHGISGRPTASID